MNNYDNPVVALISEYPPPAAGMTVLAEEFYSRLKNEGYPIVRIRTNPKLGIFSWVNRIRVFRSIFNWFIFVVNCRNILKVDVIHIFSSSGLNFLLFTIPPVLISQLTGKSIVINYHGGGAKDFFSRHPRLLKFVMKRIDKLVVPSAYLESVFNEFGFNSDVIPNIANVERFSFRKRDKINPVVISIRNLTPVYNIQCAVRAFSILQNKYPEAILYIAGDGIERKNIENLIIELNLNNVELLGNISNEDIPAYFDRADIFINTSNVDNMPGSILEAFASGLPVISTNVGGIPYMVEHGDSGLLAEANDHDMLGQYLIHVVENPAESLAMTEKASQYIDKLSWLNIKDSWLDLYKNLNRN